VSEQRGFSFSFSFSDPAAGLHCVGRSGGAAFAMSPAGAGPPVAVDVLAAGDRFDLAVAGVADAVLEPLGPPFTYGGQDRSDVLCRLRGKGAGGRALDGFGCVSRGGGELGGLALARSIWICFGPELAFALVAERPARGRGHGDERLAACVARGAPLEPSPLEDPRLSSTYREDGQLLRAGLELWEPSVEGDADARERTRALRVGGETIAAAELPEAGERRTSIAFMAWHHAGLEGIGCYTIERAVR
jgi:hypothetical protein